MAQQPCFTIENLAKSFQLRIIAVIIRDSV